MRSKNILYFLLSGCFFVFLSCSTSTDDGDSYKCTPCQDNAATVSTVKTGGTMPVTPKWAYMIQNNVSAATGTSNFNIIVMDYTKDGTEDPGQTYTPAEMTTLKTGRNVIAYLSIGEAEDYRYYFDGGWTDGSGGRPESGAPCWLNRTNPEWEGNYKVQYWSDEWQRLILGYIDRIIAYGFNGVYLDIIDAFEYWSDEDNGEGLVLTPEEAGKRMINFVKRIADHARTLNAGFLIIPQNGENILQYDANGDYLEIINGIGIEDLYYNERTAVDPGITTGRTGYLDTIKTAAGKKVLVVDYVYNGSKDAIVDAFLSKMNPKTYYPYAANVNRELDSLVIFSGQGQP